MIHKADQIKAAAAAIGLGGSGIVAQRFEEVLSVSWMAFSYVGAAAGAAIGVVTLYRITWGRKKDK